LFDFHAGDGLLVCDDRKRFHGGAAESRGAEGNELFDPGGVFGTASELKPVGHLHEFKCPPFEEVILLEFKEGGFDLPGGRRVLEGLGKGFYGNRLCHGEEEGLQDLFQGLILLHHSSFDFSLNVSKSGCWVKGAIVAMACL